MTGRPDAPVGRAPRPARPRRVVLVLPHFGLGGPQRTAVLLSAHWARLGRDVCIVTWRPEPDFFSLPRRVGRVRLPTPDGPLSRARRVIGLRSLFRGLLALQVHVTRRRWLGRAPAAYLRLQRALCWRTRALRRALTAIGPDAVMSQGYLANVVAVAASAGLPHRVVIMEVSDSTRRPLPRPLREVAYLAADVVAANSRASAAAMRTQCAEARYVPYPLARLGPGAGAPRRDATLFLGRLSPEKGPDVLIEAFARCARALPGWRLEVAGDGPLGSELRHRVTALGLAPAVTFHGAVTDPRPLLAAARIFVLPSRSEGMPNSLLEAMAHRMACVVSDASPGPLELIEHGVTGLVVETESVVGLAEALARLAREASLRARLGAAASERVREFEIDRVGPEWDRVMFQDE